MEKSNLTKILKTLSPKEFKEFGEYVHSPFFNKNESIKRLFDYLKKCYPAFDPDKISKEYVHKKIFSGAEYNDDFMRMLLFGMTKLAEDYLAYTRMKNSEWEMKHLLIHELNERHLDKSVDKALKKTLEDLDKTGKKTSDWYYFKYKMQYENVSYLRRKHLNRFDKFLKEAPLNDLHKEFTAYYLITILKMHVFLLNTRKIFKTDKDIASFEQVIDTLDRKFLKETPLIEIYYNLTMLLHADEEEYFFNLKKKMLEFDDSIDNNDMLELLINVQNYCSRRIRKGDIEFAKELFELYKLEVEGGYYAHYGYLHDVLYKGLIEIGVEIGEDEWVKKFAEDYRKQLQPEIEEDVYYYGKAFISFSEGKYDDALEHLSKVKLYDIHSKIEVKELSAKIYFEMKLEDMLFSLTDTFRHLLTNSKVLSEYRKSAYFNFIKYIKKLYKMNLKPDRGDVAEIKQMIKKEKQLENRLWLARKVREIEGRVKK